jgi:hypothetical protein
MNGGSLKFRIKQRVQLDPAAGFTARIAEGVEERRALDQYPARRGDGTESPAARAGL